MNRLYYSYVFQMFKIIFVFAVLFCQHGAFGFDSRFHTSFNIDVVRSQITVEMDKGPVNLIKTYSTSIDHNSHNKYALGCLLSGTGGVEISEERTATPEEQDIMLHGAAVAFNEMAEESILLCLNGVHGRDFTPTRAGPNVNTHYAFMRAFGLAALIAKVTEGNLSEVGRRERIISKIIQDAGQCFSNVGYDQGVNILRYLRSYAHEKKTKNRIWENYEEGFNRVLTGLVANKLGEPGAWHEPERHIATDTFHKGKNVVFVADYHSAGMVPDFAYTLRDGSSVVIQDVKPSEELSYGTTPSIRAHFAIFPDTNSGKTSATVELKNITNHVGRTISDLYLSGQVYIHPGDRGHPTLSPANMVIDFLPKNPTPSEYDTGGTYSFTSHVHPHGWGKPIETFHMLLSGLDLHRNMKHFQEIYRHMGVAISQTKALPEVIFNLYFSGFEKPHVQQMIDFIAVHLQGHRP